MSSLQVSVIQRPSYPVHDPAYLVAVTLWRAGHDLPTCHGQGGVEEDMLVIDGKDAGVGLRARVDFILGKILKDIRYSIYRHDVYVCYCANLLIVKNWLKESINLISTKFIDISKSSILIYIDLYSPSSFHHVKPHRTVQLTN